MAGHPLDKSSQTTVPRFSVAGTYARPEQDKFVEHAALLREECELAFGDDAAVWHAVPPVVAGEESSRRSHQEYDNCEVHAVSYLDDLASDEMAGIMTVLAEIDAQTQPTASALGQYIVHPPVEWVTDLKTGTKRFRKFSCVGFVVECYDVGANVQLLDIASSELPPVDLETLASAYGDRIRNERLRGRLGIHGDGPWRIALAGYLLNSLARPANEVRRIAHVPENVGEAAFPVEDASDLSEDLNDANDETKG